MWLNPGVRGKYRREVENLGMLFDLERVRLKNVKEATTEDLLDRATVFRNGMEPAALTLIDAELNERGYTALDIEHHARVRGESALMLPDGVAARCSFCFKPATTEGWGWHRFLWQVPAMAAVLSLLRGTRSPNLADGFLNVVSGDEPRGAPSRLSAQPAHDRRNVGQVALLDEFDHTQVLTGTLFGLEKAVFMSATLPYRPVVVPANARPCTMCRYPSDD